MSTSSLALDSSHGLLVDQAGVDGRLPQAEEGLQDVDLGLGHAGLGDPLGEHGAVVGPQLVVAFPLLAFQVAVQRLLGLLRQLGQDLLLGAAENERPQRAAEQRQPLAVLGDLLRDVLETPTPCRACPG